MRSSLNSPLYTSLRSHGADERGNQSPQQGTLDVEFHLTWPSQPVGTKITNLNRIQGCRHSSTNDVKQETVVTEEIKYLMYNCIYLSIFLLNITIN